MAASVGVLGPYGRVRITMEDSADAYSMVMFATTDQQQDRSWPVDIKITCPTSAGHLVAELSWAYLLKDPRGVLNDEDLAWVVAGMAAQTVAHANGLLNKEKPTIPYTYDQILEDVKASLAKHPLARGAGWPTPSKE